MPEPLAARLVALLRERGLTLATAETDTGGLIGSWLTDVPGSSAVFIGGVTAYHSGPKMGLLGVPRALLHEHGSVSAAAAHALAEGARRALGADIAVAESGITGPTGGSDARPVGTVWIACAGPGARLVAERRVWILDREGNKRRTVVRALQMVIEAAQSVPRA